jgi:hypothetical protein
MTSGHRSHPTKSIANLKINLYSTLTHRILKSKKERYLPSKSRSWIRQPLKRSQLSKRRSLEFHLYLSLNNLRRHRSIINNFSRTHLTINSKMAAFQVVWYKATGLQVSSNHNIKRRLPCKKRSPSRLIRWALPLSALATFMPQQMTKETEIFTGHNLHNPWNLSSGLTTKARKMKNKLWAFNLTSSSLSSCKKQI